MTNIHHAIDYVEIYVGDRMARTRSFYEQAFGWSFKD
jgi:predicted enzyme related to lactoylglutathione lyase